MYAYQEHERVIVFLIISNEKLHRIVFFKVKWNMLLLLHADNSAKIKSIELEEVSKIISRRITM
jgi:hypothetical protein